MISKKHAINRAKYILGSKLNSFTKLYMFPEKMNGKEVMNCEEKPVFTCLKGRMDGWLFLLDKFPVKDGPHLYEYLFVIDNMMYTIRENNFYPINKDKFEDITTLI